MRPRPPAVVTADRPQWHSLPVYCCLICGTDHREMPCEVCGRLHKLVDGEWKWREICWSHEHQLFACLRCHFEAQSTGQPSRYALPSWATIP